MQLALSLFGETPEPIAPPAVLSLSRHETIAQLREARERLMRSEEWEEKSRLQVRIVELENHLGDAELARSILFEVFRNG